MRTLPYLVNLASGIVLVLATRVLNRAGESRERTAKEAEEKTKALSEGVESLLRESIVGNYNKYSERGYCPIYAKESIKKVYKAYHGLGGNDVATELYQKLIHMPEEAAEGGGTA